MRVLNAKNLQDILGISKEDAQHLVSAARQAETPQAVDRVLDMADTIIGGFGVEALQPDNAYYVDRYYHDIHLLYVNMGDTYSDTVLYATESRRFGIGSWGDWLEAWERRQSRRSAW